MPVTSGSARQLCHNRVNPNNILQRLIPRDGFERWDTFCASFGLPADLPFEALARHLRELGDSSTSYTAQHTHFFSPLFLTTKTGVPSAITMFRFVRLCFRWQEGDGKCPNGDECDCLHVCRDWIAGTCDRGTRCDRGHSFVQTSRPLAQIPLPLHESSSDPTLCAQLPPACVRAVQLERRMQQTLTLPATAPLQLVSARRVTQRVPVPRHALARPALGAVSRGVRALQPDGLREQPQLPLTALASHAARWRCCCWRSTDQLAQRRVEGRRNVGLHVRYARGCHLVANRM